MLQKNNPQLFPALNPEVLSSFAHTWAKYHTSMDRIVLYRPSVLEEYGKKYLLHFEINDDEEFNYSIPEDLTEKQKKMRKELIAVLKEEDKSFKYLLEGPDALIWLGTGNKFKEVYVNTPSNDFFQKEWVFTSRLPEYIDQKHKWVLFDKIEASEEPAVPKQKTGSKPCLSTSAREIINKEGVKKIDRGEPHKNDLVLRWKGIANFIDRSVSTAKRWHYDNKMPVYKNPVRIHTSEVIEWMSKRKPKKGTNPQK